MLTIDALPAGEGDALWVEWGDDVRHRMIIDMGRAVGGRKMRKKLIALPLANREVELLVVTHVDQDHIQGVLNSFTKEDEDSGTRFNDIWFNGWKHLHGLNIEDDAPPFNDGGPVQNVGQGMQSFGAVQGETLTPWVAASGVWNKAFNGNPARRGQGALDTKVNLPEGMTLTLLGPTQDILSGFIESWRDEITDLEKKKKTTIADYVNQMIGRDVLTFGRRPRPKKPTLNSHDDLKSLAKRDAGEKDKKPANGSSICFIADYNGKRVLFTGDAHSDDLIAALNLIDPANPVKFDLVKLPHHTSKKNVSRELIEKLDCSRFLTSTNGNHHYHPDAEAIARIIAFSKNGVELLFNEPSEFNLWWSDPNWKDRFGYSTRYGTKDDGLIVTL